MTLRGQIEEQLETLRGWMTEFKELDEKDREREQVEATLRRQIEEIERRMEERESHCKELETILHGQIEDLDRELTEKMSIHREEKRDWKKVEGALCGQIEELKRTISDMDSDRQKDKDVHVEETLHGQMEDHQDEDCSPVEDVKRRSEESESQSRDMETVLNDQIEDLDRKFQEQRRIHGEIHRYWKNVEMALHGPINQLKRTISEIDWNRGKLKDTLPCPINKQEDAPQQTDKDEQIEETIHGQVEDLEEQEGSHEPTDTDED
jgi:chromosome segregation ATPase